MKKNPLVSIIIPTYNRAKNLPNAIGSVINQSYTNWELLIIDDGSIDDTEKVVMNIIKKNNTKCSIFYFKNKFNKGNAEARNVGVRKAKGTFITFLDDDDIYLPTKIEEQINILKESHKKHCFVGMIWIENGKAIKRTKIINDPNNSIETGNGIFGMFHRSIFEEIGYFDKIFPANVDGDFLFRVNKKYSPAFINKDLYIHYYHDNNISSDNKKKIKGWEIMLEKHRGVFNKHEFFSVYLKLVIFYLFNKIKRFDYILKSIWHKPSLKNIALLFILLIPSISVSKFLINKLLDIQGYPRSFAGRYFEEQNGK